VLIIITSEHPYLKYGHTSATTTWRPSNKFTHLELLSKCDKLLVHCYHVISWHGNNQQVSDRPRSDTCSTVIQRQHIVTFQYWIQKSTTFSDLMTAIYRQLITKSKFSICSADMIMRSVATWVNNDVNRVNRDNNGRLTIQRGRDINARCITLVIDYTIVPLCKHLDIQLTNYTHRTYHADLIWSYADELSTIWTVRLSLRFFIKQNKQFL